MASVKKRLLYIGDAMAPTGFATVNEHILTRLDKDYWGKPYLMAINWNGDPNPLQQHVMAYPARTMSNEDAFGVNRVADIVASVKPDVVVAHQDAWIIGMYIEAIKQRDVKPFPKIIAWCPPDAENQTAGKNLNDVVHLVTPSRFGMRALKAGGYTGHASVIRYGVDHAQFRPFADKRQTRKDIGIPEVALDGWLLGRADRNAVRKRYDLTLAAFGKWWNESGKPEDAFLYLHCAPRDIGWDLIQLCSYFGIGSEQHPHVIFTSHQLRATQVGMLPREAMPRIYNLWDVHMSNAVGEGGGLVALESAACGVAQILPRVASLAEWFDGAAHFINAEEPFVHTGGINTVGKSSRLDDVVEAIDHVYRNRQYQAGLQQEAIARAAEFTWEEAASSIDALAQQVAEMEVQK
jgi:glycosyltransferase involved in cell wall biosynthesis